MKHVIIIPALLVVLLIIMTRVTFANDGKYIETMTKTMVTLYEAPDAETLQKAINTFERIGEAEKNKWEPFYYAGYGYVMLALREKEGAKKDTWLDLGLKAVEKAKAIQANESEVIALEGFVHMIRVTVDPASRGQQYSGMAFQSFSKAAALNPENPRALALLAQMQYGTAQFFGSATTEACATLAKALAKFESFTSDNVLAPKWGKGMAEGMKEKCQ